MTKPQYITRIKGKDFDCLGEQLVSILELIKADLKDVIWYAADVETNGPTPFKLGLQGSTAKKIGNTEELIAVTKNVDQFLCGVFLAMPKE